MSIRIVKFGMPGQQMTVEEDTAECILKALAEVLGARVQFDWAEKEIDAEVGSVAVERKT